MNNKTDKGYYSNFILNTYYIQYKFHHKSQQYISLQNYKSILDFTHVQISIHVLYTNDYIQLVVCTLLGSYSE